ncbi:MAG: CopG family ribbon-helix-helix protein [Pseudomonadota bacterium]
MKRAVTNKAKTQPLSIRLQAGLDAQLTALAGAFDRSKSWIIEQAIRDYVALQAWQLAAIEEGIAAADAGHLVSHEDVAAWVESWDQADETPMPG